MSTAKKTAPKDEKKPTATHPKKSAAGSAPKAGPRKRLAKGQRIAIRKAKSALRQTLLEGPELQKKLKELRTKAYKALMK
ncbi:MAG: hypothetical protein AB7F75_01570 [Planctomycetota bacterium]